MNADPQLLVVTSPRVEGKLVKDIQYLLAGHNRFADTTSPLHTYHGKVDGVYGPLTAAAVRRAKYLLGYPEKQVNGVAGPLFYAYLVTKASHAHRLLPKDFLARRRVRLKAEEKRRLKSASSRKVKALSIAIHEAAMGVHESGYSNWNKYGAWFGFNGVPWCAEFVSYCMNHAGIPLKTALAFQFEYWAHAGEHGLHVTGNPEPGDIVVYHHNQGHVGIFRRWVDRSKGVFEAVEGNTMGPGGSQDNGGQVLVQRRDTGWVPTVFVRVP